MTTERAVHDSLAIQVAGAVLNADLVVPESAKGVVLFAHGSGSGRHSPRNRYVASELQRAGLATMLADLLTIELVHPPLAAGAALIRKSHADVHRNVCVCMGNGCSAGG